jgi:hypothetical protein
MNKKDKIEFLKKHIKKFYKQYEFDIVEFEILDRNQYDGNEWIPDTPSLFITIKMKNFDDRSKISEEMLTYFFNYDFNIKFQ